MWGKANLRAGGFLFAAVGAFLVAASCCGQAQAAGAVKLTDGTLRPADLFLGYRMLISPDGTCVVFTADTAVGETTALFSVPIAGGPLVQLSSSTIDPANYPNGLWSGKKVFEITPDGQSVVFSSEPSVGNVNLYSVPICGGNPGLLKSFAGDEVGTFSFLISPDSTRVVYGLGFEEDAVGARRTVIYSSPVPARSPP